MSETRCNLKDIPGHDCAVDPCEPTLDELCLCEEKTADGFHDDKCPVLVPAVPVQPEPVLAVSIAEQAFHLLAQHAEQGEGFWCESGGIIDATVYWSRARDIVKSRPAVPAQEAPRDKYPENCPLCKREDHYAWAFTGCPSETTKDGAEPLKAEPQAGAQVPSQDEIGSILVAAIDRHITDESLRDLAVIAANGIYWRNQRIGELEAHLNTIKSYAVEAAKTPITREDMHDPLKAQTFYDEAKGFERLVLSEIGASK